MTAQFIPIGEPAQDAERQALRFLVEGLPSGYTVYGNPWLVERSGVIYELDAVVVAPHAIYVVEIKSFRGVIEGTDNDWWTPSKIRSPLRKNRLTAQILKGHLRSASSLAGQVWVEGLIFLSATTEVRVRGPASNDRLHTRKTVLVALQDQPLIARLSQGRSAPSSQAERELLELFTGTRRDGPKPVRRVREYEIVDTFEHSEAFSELLGRNELTEEQRLLRIYSVPALAGESQRERVAERARWEAQVLGRLGRCPGILAAAPPFADESGYVLPLEYFEGITLATWVERYGPDNHGDERADLKTRTDLWLRIAQTLDDAHRQGVVHRLLRPEVILVEDCQSPKEYRVTGFDLAKQLKAETSAHLTGISDERLAFAAPEVVNQFSDAQPASDQFSLGAILALLLTGKRLFENTRQLIANRRLLRRVRAQAPHLPLSLDEAVSRMVELRPQDRYAELPEAMAAVRAGRGEEARLSQKEPERQLLDADNLEPGARVGADYEILSRLGQGGMSVVYSARHLVSGRKRALKIARNEAAAEDALRGEFDVLYGLDHPNVVRVKDLTKAVEGRLTLVMERVGEMTLRQFLLAHPAPCPIEQRRLAEDLLSGLEYLEQRGIQHKDLKPDNLLVADGRLVIIDFSLAGMPEDAAYGGTALYRDPSSVRWTHGTDRYAAALCLFELYAGRHAFDGRVPEPGERPTVSREDIDPPGLAKFFEKALDPVPERRFPSCKVMRDLLLVALGEEPPAATGTPPPQHLDATTPLRLAGLSRRASNALHRCQLRTVGELLALSESQVRALHSIGSKTAEELISFQEVARGMGLEPSFGTLQADPPLLAALMDSLESVQSLPLSDTLRAALTQAELPTVGAVATLSRAQLLALPGIGQKKLAEVVQALQQFQERGGEPATPTLDRLWHLASRPLGENQRIAIERAVGLFGEPEPQVQIAEDLGKSPQQVSFDLSQGLERLEGEQLAEVLDVFEELLRAYGGLLTLAELGARLEESWPAGVLTGEGMARLLVRVSALAIRLFEVAGGCGPVVALHYFDRAGLELFVAEVERLAREWPPIEPELARRALKVLLPHFGGDPLALGVRLCAAVEVASTQHLYVGPLEPKQTLSFVLERSRDAIDLAELESKVRGIFGPSATYPSQDHLIGILRDLECRVQGNLVLPGRTSSLLARSAPAADEPPWAGAGRSAEEVVRDMLRDAAKSRGFRMLVTPPERHREIGRSVAAALGGQWISFEDTFFSEHAAELSLLERAERFAAQRHDLTEAAEATLFRLLEENGQAGKVLVLGDTALWGLCEALDLPRRLYDETLSGAFGFWVLLVPGVIHKRQPHFNEGPPMWHLEGATLPLLNPLPPTATSSGG